VSVSDELKAKREALILAHLDGETRMDPDAVLATLTEDAVYELPAIDRTYRGHEAIRGFLEVVFAATAGTVHRAQRIHHADDAVIVETLSEIPGLDAPVPGVAVFPFEGDRALGERLYADYSPLLSYLDKIGEPSD
jgi:hypothetical protein